MQPDLAPVLLNHEIRPCHAQMHTLGSKLTLLALHFPRLRVIWSRSLHATADIFRALKANQDDPDPIEAQAVGERSLSPPSALPPRSHLSLRWTQRP